MNKLTTCQIRRVRDSEVVEFETRYKWVTVGQCILEYDGYKIVVPTGFLCDGSSGGPDIGFSWLFHDYLYATHEINGIQCTRKQVDGFMMSVLTWERASLYKKAVHFLTRVNPFWLFSRAWEKSGQRGAEFL